MSTTRFRRPALGARWSFSQIRAAFDVPAPSRAWLWWTPCVLGGLYALTILVHLHAIVYAVGLSSDSDIDAVLAHMSIHMPAGSQLTTGDFPHYETMAFALLTRSLPFYRQLWELAPVIFAAIGLGAVVWSVWRAFGRWPAVLVASVLTCFSGGGVATVAAGGLATVFAFDAHANSVITAAVCGAGLVWILPRIGALPVWKIPAAAAALGVLGGLPLAGDDLYLAWGLGPTLVVIALAAWRGPQNVAARVLAFGVLAVAVTGLTSLCFAAAMRHAGVHGFTQSYHALVRFTTPGGLVTNFETMLWALPSLTASSFFGKTLTPRSELELLNASLVFAALFAVAWSVRKQVAGSLPRVGDGGQPISGRFIHTAFWTTTLGLGLLIFLIGSPAPWTTDGRYLLGPYVAVAALLPLLVERGLGWKLIVTAAASLFVFSTLYQFPIDLREMRAGYQSASVANAVAAYAKHERVAVGYGNYWNSIDLIWNSDFKVDIYPVQNCEYALSRKNPPYQLCTFTGISISDWNKPRSGVRSMLVVNPTAAGVQKRWAALGTPIASTRIGGLILYVYPYDIAAKFERTRFTF